MIAPGAAAPRAVFFDLDGTLADTAADLAAPVNAMRAERGMEPLALEVLRPFASMGARGLIGRALGVAKEQPEFEPLRLDFLARYERQMCLHTRLFDGMHEVIDALDASAIRWGVVSNKFERYVRPIVERLGLGTRSATAVGGDTTAYAKPHPEPLLHAARLVGADPAHCIYVGDDLRDVQAGRAAGMAALVAGWGYTGSGAAPAQWGADAVLSVPEDLLNWLELP